MYHLVKEILQPGEEFSPIPFWFFNDGFDEAKVRSQLADYVDKGVGGFVLHPRIGIPKDMPYLSESYFAAVRFIVETADALDMKVVLYDEGMYPSGSAHGKVVEANPEYAAKGLFLAEESETRGVREGEIFHGRHGKAQLVRRLLDGRALAYGFTGGTIRGIHFGEDDGEADAPKAADILNPEAVDEFIRLTHEAYYEHLREYFGRTIIAFFTDEPCALGRGGAWCREWTPGLEKEIEDAGGRVEELAALFEGAGMAPRGNVAVKREEADGGAEGTESSTVSLYRKLIKKRLREVFYGRLSEWCGSHGIALMGHPAESDDIEEELYFHIPGQDLIMRRVAPETGGLLEADSVQAKLSADIARLLGRRRNANECFGVCYRSGIPWYMTAGDMKWYIDWLGIRGVNLFVPHAFYYSVEGARKGERPPDVGPNNIWWRHYKMFSDYMKRLSWLMTDSENGARLAVLCDDNRVPYREVACLYENQIEFCYLPTALLEKASVRDGAVQVNGHQFYRVLNFLGEAYRRRFADRLGELLLTVEAVGEDIQTAMQGMPEREADSVDLRGTLTEDDNLTVFTGRKIVLSEPCRNLRKVSLCKAGAEMVLFSNEGEDAIQRTVRIADWRNPLFIDIWKGAVYCVEGAGEEFPLYLRPRETVLVVDVARAADAGGAAGETDTGGTAEEINAGAFPGGHLSTGCHDRPGMGADGEDSEIPIETRKAEWFRKEYPDWTERFVLVNQGENEREYLMKFVCSGEDIPEGFEVSGTEMVECWCNGRFAGVSFWGKHRFETGQYMDAGENEVRLKVTGNAANLYGNREIAYGLGIKGD